MKRKSLILFTVHFLLFTCIISFTSFSQDMSPLVNKLKAKLDVVNDYVATGKMKTNVVFIKVPLSNISVYYKKPDFFKIKRDGGISILPKGGVSINMNSILTTTNFMALAAGTAMVNGVNTQIIKLLPLDENSDVVLTTLYIDDKNLLVLRAISTTKDNGTFQIDLTYGNYIIYGLPDKVVFSFDTKDYKMPKGVTLETDANESQSDIDKLKNKKGKIEISYNSYIINKGIDDGAFK